MRFQDEIWRRLGAFLREEDGPTAMEYAVLLVLVMVALMASISAVAQSMRAVFNATATAVTLTG